MIIIMMHYLTIIIIMVIIDIIYYVMSFPCYSKRSSLFVKKTDDESLYKTRLKSLKTKLKERVRFIRRCKPINCLIRAN